MLWELSVAEQRYRAVLDVGMGVPVTEVAERYGVSRQSVHAWLLRYRQEGIAGLEDRSHQVHHHPWRIPAEVEGLICELRRGHARWGPRRLVFEMGRRGHQVTRSTVYRTLVRNGLVEPKPRRRKRKDYRRWERAVAMELWQLDVTASAFLIDGAKVKIVTGVDDHSRFCMIATAVMRASARPVCLAFVEAMGVYGVPEEVLTDNGKVFTGRFHKPEVKLDAADAAELAEMLQFLSQWLAREPACLSASLAEFVSHPAYGLAQLRDDLERFVFLLGGSDGESLFGPAG